MIPRALKVVKWLYFVNNVVPFYNASKKEEHVGARVSSMHVG